MSPRSAAPNVGNGLATDPIAGGHFPLNQHATKRQNRANVVSRQFGRTGILATGRAPFVRLGTAANVEIRDSATATAPKFDVLAGL